jgi:hypothetical protein
MPSKYSTYRLGLISAASVKVEAPPLMLTPSKLSMLFRGIQQTVMSLKPVLLFLCGTFVVGLLLWIMTRSSPSAPIHILLNKIFVDSHGWWFKVMLAVLLPILFGLVLGPEVPVIVLLLTLPFVFLLKKYLDRYWLFTALQTSEIIVAIICHLIALRIGE